MWQGKLSHIHVAEEGRAPMQSLKVANLIAGTGIEGDRYAAGRGKNSSLPDIREMTLIEDETLEALRRDHKIDLTVDEHRRNLTTRDVPLNHLVGGRFRVGGVLLEGGEIAVGDGISLA